MKTQNEKQTTVAGNQKTAGGLSTALPLNLISPLSRWHSSSIYLQADYAPLRSIVHDRCVICGSRDWLLFERLEATAPMVDDVNEMFRFWFAGLEKRQTVCVCLDCSLESRTGFWDRRLSERFASRADINTVIHPSLYPYYRLLKNRITPPTRRFIGGLREKGLVEGRGRNYHKYVIQQSLGGKCTACSQAINLRFDCIRSQLVRHTSGVDCHKSARFWYHQLLHGNAQLLCPDCYRRKKADQTRALGHFRRLLFGYKLIAWADTNAAARAALSLRMENRKPFHIERLKPLEPILCSVHSCGHVKPFHRLAAEEAESRLWFICEDCWLKAPANYRKLALLYELSPKAMELNRYTPQVEVWNN